MVYVFGPNLVIRIATNTKNEVDISMTNNFCHKNGRLFFGQSKLGGACVAAKQSLAFALFPARTTMALGGCRFKASQKRSDAKPAAVDA